MKNEAPAPKTSQPDNQPMSYGSGVKPNSSKSNDGKHTPSPAGKSSAPWQAGNGSGRATDANKPSQSSDGDSYATDKNLG